MKAHVCQYCGSIVRRLGSKCQSCGNVVTKHSCTSVNSLAEPAPNTVAVKTDPLLAEKMICKLHHAATLASAANGMGGSEVATAVLEPFLSFPINSSPAGDAAARNSAEFSSPEVTAHKSDSASSVSRKNEACCAGDFFAEVVASMGIPASESMASTESLPVSSSNFSATADESASGSSRNESGDDACGVSGTPAAAAAQRETADLPASGEESSLLQSRVGSIAAQQKLKLTAAATRPFQEPDRAEGRGWQIKEPAAIQPEAQYDQDTRRLMQRLLDSKISAGDKSKSENESFFDGSPQVERAARPRLHPRGISELEVKVKSKQGKVPGFRIKLPAQAGLASILIILGLTVMAFVLGSDLKQFFGQSSPAAWPKSIEGTYSYFFVDKNGDPKNGLLSLAQDRNGSLAGTGTDTIFRRAGLTRSATPRQFSLLGEYKAPHLKLYKTYQGSERHIIYEGDAAYSNGKIELGGSWQFAESSAPDGLSQPKHRWSALLTRAQVLPRAAWQQHNFNAEGNGVHGTARPLPSGNPGNYTPVKPAPENRKTESNWFKDIIWNEDEAPAARFMRILLICVVFGVGLVRISLKFFGLNGLINLWEREKYIPFSVRAQHLKLMKELGGGRRHGLLLGERVEWALHEFWRPRRLYYPEARRERNPHVLAMGAGAKGKTRLLANMIINDIKNNDRAVVVVDSEGSLVELIARWLGSRPEASKVLRRVSIIDPCRSQCRLAFNPLINGSPDNLQSAANAIVMGFKSVYTETQNQQNQWTQQTANILRNAVLLLMLNQRNLEDLPVLLSDNDFRDVLLEKIEKEMASEWKTLIDAWTNYKRLARSEQWLNWIEPILNRVQPLLSDQRISRLLNARDNCIDLAELISEKRILLVRVPEGQLEKGGNLLGSLIITGLRHAGLTQYERTGDCAQPCSLYLDEMNNFIDAEAFEAICSDLRKVQIGIHATLKTLHDLSEEFRNRVLLNFGILALFSISKKDADILGPTVFRVDGRKIKKVTPRDIFNPVNATPTMDFASDEEKININRLVGQEERQFYCHLVGTEAGVFRLRAPEFNDIARGDVNWDLIETLYDSEKDDEDE